jgi:tripartite-type tricarboxylate transporter receptor subunit TctC
LRVIAFSLTLLYAAVCAGSVRADPVEDFYRGKVITLYVASEAGGGYGIYGQLAARHLGRHIPGHPEIIPSFMPGGGGLAAANYLYNAARQDGTALGVLFAQLQLAQFIHPTKVKYDATRFHWLGIFADITQGFVVAKRAKATDLEQLKQVSIVAGSTGAGSDTFLLPTLANRTLGLKLKIVTGYNGTQSLALAMERGEIDGFASPWGSFRGSFPQSLQQGIPLFQYGLAPDAGFPQVPLLTDLVTDPEQRAMVRFLSGPSTIGRSLTAPPSVPADRVAALRQAFDALVTDRDFLAEADKQHIELRPMSGSKAQALIDDLSKVDPRALALAKQIVPSEE